KNKTGLDKEVRDFVMSSPEAQELRKKHFDMIDFLIPLYMKEGKSQLIIAFGCTGGHHRSVTFAFEMCEHLRAKGFNVGINHRDITK
ncbi:MAG: RNase adaptor protein RapZ, partial [Clostridia bacterium]|nr:RNase adaptor protein RapZ [Clostridia bacterium]